MNSATSYNSIANGKLTKNNILPATNNSATNGQCHAPPSDRVEWSRATILGFIEDYRRQRVLWDPNTKGYHIKQTKYEALKALGEKYGTEIRSIRSKIKSLRSSFHREHGKVINGRRKGLNYQPMWFAYDAIRFILDGENVDDKNAVDTEAVKHETNSKQMSEAAANWCGAGDTTDEDLSDERCKFSRHDIEQFNNHFLAFGLQTRQPMVMIAATEADAQGQYTKELNQQVHKFPLDKHSSTAQLNVLQLSRQHKVSGLASSSKPAIKSIDNNGHQALKILTPLPTTIAHSMSPQPMPNINSDSNHFYVSPPKALHLNDISVGMSSTATAAAALPSSLTITSVARNIRDFDGDDYGNIRAGDVKTEIVESDLNYERNRSSLFAPFNYEKDVVNPICYSRKRKTQSSTIEVSDDEETTPPVKLQDNDQQQHKAHEQHAISNNHRQQCEFLNNFGINYNNISTSAGNSHTNTSHNNDEYGIFGEYVGITIRRLKTSKSKIVVKHLINNILYEAELGKYDQGIPACKEPPELYKM